MSTQEVLDFDPPEMLSYIKYVQKYFLNQPKTYWCEFPFFMIVSGLHLGQRPQDLDQITTIGKKVWKKHQAYLNRLDRFPLDKAEYYLKLKESHGVNTVRELSVITGEDYSHIAKILKILSLPDKIKDFLRNNKENPVIIKHFHFRRLLDIVRQGEERRQFARFREFMEEV